MSEGGLDVQSWVRSVQQGDEVAARALFNHLFPLVIKVVRANLPRRTSEEDLVQTVFMKLFAKLDQFSGRVPLEHWVSRIAVNTCLNQISTERVRPELRWADLNEAEERVLQSLASTTDDLEPSHNLASRELVGKLLEALSPADRLVITLMHLEGRTVGEVREITGWNASLVKVRAFRARLKMRKHLEILLDGNGL
ncbi:MAG: RNA polymerase sigma factor [Verrucomicrobiota bacterium]